MVMFELTLFPLAFVMLPDISLDLCMSPFHFNFHLIFAWHFTWSLHFKMGFAIHLELYLVFHLIFSHRMMTFLTLTWDFICRDPALPWLLHGWVFPLVEGQTPKAEDDEESFQEAFFSIYLFIFLCVYIYMLSCPRSGGVANWPYLSKHSLDQPFTWQSIHLMDLSQKQVITWPTFSFDKVCTWLTFHLAKSSLDSAFTWPTFCLTNTLHLTHWQFDNPFTWEPFHLIFSHLNHSWSVFFHLTCSLALTLGQFTCSSLDSM